MADPGPSTAVPQHAPPELHADYLERRDEIARWATGSGQTPAEVDYRPEEDRTWAIVITTLHRLWESLAAPEIVRARDRIRLATDRVPQLTEVSAALEPRSGFVFEAVPGLVGVDDFFGALGAGRFLSTQYIRHHEAPLYTPEPDIIHEVIGHGTCLAQPHLAMLHREAGSAMMRMTSDRSRQFLADVFWFSLEFGVLITPLGPRALGAGLLSSVGELNWFHDKARVRPVDIDAMGSTRYDISTYQPTLFGCRSLNQLVDVVGEFFATATSEAVDERAQRASTMT